MLLPYYYSSKVAALSLSMLQLQAMKANLWQELPTPFFVQAPMENVTDVVFREIIAFCGKPDVFFTEFTNTDGLCSKGKDAVAKRLLFTKNQRPIIAQIWGTNPDHYFQSSKMLVEMGFDGIDINMGCPERSIVSHGSCGGLIKNPQLAKEIIEATKQGSENNLPISVKTRIGFNNIQTEEWCGFLLDQDIAALTIHGRTVREMSKVPAHWDEIAKVVTIRNEKKLKTKIIGNGDVENYQDAIAKKKMSGVDGIMIGRGIFTNLWIFNPDIDPETIPTEEKLQLLIRHIKLFDETLKGSKPFDLMKKFYKVYVSGMPNASEFRMELMEKKTPAETIAFLRTKMKAA